MKIMMFTDGICCKRILLIFTVLVVTAMHTVAGAAPINYGDFAGSSVMYIDVTESANTPGDSEPLTGAPSIRANQLDFDPMGFVAYGPGDSVDLTDAQLNFSVESIFPNVIDTITIDARGDYVLLAGAQGANSINYGISIGSITVRTIDFIARTVPLDLSAAAAAGGDSIGDDMLTTWKNALVYDVSAALGAAGINQGGATAIDIVIDTAVAAIGEPGGLSYIAAKDLSVEIGVGTLFTGGEATAANPVPLPPAIVLLFTGTLALGMIRKRQSRPL